MKNNLRSGCSLKYELSKASSAVARFFGSYVKRLKKHTQHCIVMQKIQEYQSINQSINQSIDQAHNKSKDRTGNQSINGSTAVRLKDRLTMIPIKQAKSGFGEPAKSVLEIIVRLLSANVKFLHAWKFAVSRPDGFRGRAQEIDDQSQLMDFRFSSQKRFVEEQLSEYATKKQKTK